MRIATLQLSPRLGDVEGNIRRANALVDNLEKRLMGLKCEGEREGGRRGGGGVPAGAGAGAAAGLLDVLVLPEMAFTGYNFPSLQAIRPYLEPTESGPTAQWARSTARRLGCVVCVGYPELAEAGAGAGDKSNLETSPSAYLPPTSSSLTSDMHMAAGNKDRDEPPEAVRHHANGDRKENKPEVEAKTTHNGSMKSTNEEGSGNGNDIITSPNNNDNNDNNDSNNENTTTPPSRFNSALIVSPTGSTLYNYQKRFLYYTDEPWAAEGRNGKGFLHLQLPSTTTTTSPNTAPTAIGICMDINPYKFLTPWTTYEFATHVLTSGAKLVLLPMAWLTLLRPVELEALDDGSLAHHRPDLETFKYWIMRFWPLVARRKGNAGKGEGGKEEVILVFANRVGVEEGGIKIGEDGDGVARYAGSSCVVGIRRKGKGKGDDVVSAAAAAAAGSEGGDGMSSTGGGGGGLGEEAEIVVWEMLGRAEEGVCLVDTDAEPKMVFRMREPGGDDDDGGDGDESS